MRILSRDEWKCRLCGDHENTLHIHHDKYHKEPWDADEKDLKAVCRNCHSIIHDVKRIDGATVLHIEKNEKADPYTYEVYVRGPETTGIAFYSVSDKGVAKFLYGFYKSAIDRFSAILNSF